MIPLDIVKFVENVLMDCDRDSEDDGDCDEDIGISTEKRILNFFTPPCSSTIAHSIDIISLNL